jgi:outer membrane protein assembly factor BamD
MRFIHHVDGLRAALGIVLILLCSCSSKVAKQKNLSDAQLLSSGLQKASVKKHRDAIEYFEALLQRFPNSPLAARAQLALAESRAARGDNIEAEAAFDDFLRLYPASDNVSYALFRKGELLLRQAGQPGRDQTKTREAIKVFESVRQRFPQTPYAEEAGARIARMRNRLAEHEGKLISHYLARRKFESAESRARKAVAEYGDTAALPSLLSLLAESLSRGGKGAEADSVRKSLAERFPDFGAKKR